MQILSKERNIKMEQLTQQQLGNGVTIDCLYINNRLSLSISLFLFLFLPREHGDESE